MYDLGDMLAISGVSMVVGFVMAVVATTIDRRILERQLWAQWEREQAKKMAGR